MALFGHPLEDGTEPCLNFRASSESSYACSLNLQSAITPHIFTRIIRSMSLCFLFRLSRSSPDRFYRLRSHRATDNSLNCRETRERLPDNGFDFQNVELTYDFFRFVR